MNSHKGIRPETEEAQLSQRDRAMLRVIEYFAKSLKIIRNDTQGKRINIAPLL